MELPNKRFFPPLHNDFDQHLLNGWPHFALRVAAANAHYEASVCTRALKHFSIETDLPVAATDDRSYQVVEYCRLAYEAYAKEIATKHSQACWLYYLRRVDTRLLPAEQPSTWPYCIRIALSITGKYATNIDDCHITHHGLRFDLDQQLRKSLTRLLALSRAIQGTLAMRRILGKGGYLSIDNGFLYVSRPDQIDMAIHYLDLRGWRETNSLSRFGLGHSTPEVARVPLHFVTTTFPIQPSPCPNIDSKSIVSVVQMYGTAAVDVAPLLQLLDALPGGMQELGGPRSKLLFALLLNIHNLLLLPDAMRCIYQFGYVCASLPYMLFAIADVLASARASNLPWLRNALKGYTPWDFLEELAHYHGSVEFADPSPVVRTSDDDRFVMLDLIAATHELENLIDPGQIEGAHANERGLAFEQAVQLAIDVSAWSPSPDLRTLIRRTLTRHKNAVTDIDAVGVNGNTLLVVSVKSFARTLAYERGDYNAVRNVESHVLGSAKNWSEIWSQQPLVFDNFDVFTFSRIIHCVVMPFPPYCRTGLPTACIEDGLPYVASFAEFLAWLQPDRHSK